MGDRGNIKVTMRSYATGEKQSLYYYTHTGGSELSESLMRGLIWAWSQGRWNDPAYFARQIFDELARGFPRDYPYSLGISFDIQDNEHKIYEVDMDERVIRLLEEDGKTEITSWEYDAFIQRHKNVRARAEQTLGVRYQEVVTV